MVHNFSIVTTTLQEQQQALALSVEIKSLAMCVLYPTVYSRVQYTHS